MEILKFDSFKERYTENRLRNWMSRVMGNVQFTPESVLIVDSHTHYYQIGLDWRKENLIGKVGTNPAVDFVPPVLYFEKAADAMLWYMTWG